MKKKVYSLNKKNFHFAEVLTGRKCLVFNYLPSVSVFAKCGTIKMRFVDLPHNIGIYFI